MTISQWQVLFLFVVMWAEILFFAGIVVWVRSDPPSDGAVPIWQTWQTHSLYPIPAEPVESNEIPTKLVHNPILVDSLETEQPVQIADNGDVINNHPVMETMDTKPKPTRVGRVLISRRLN